MRTMMIAFVYLVHFVAENVSHKRHKSHKQL